MIAVILGRRRMALFHNEASKQVNESVATEIYGPYPKDKPEGQYKISYLNPHGIAERTEVWVKDFEELISALDRILKTE